MSGSVWKVVDYSGSFWKETCRRFQSGVLVMYGLVMDETVEKVLL